MTNEQFSALAKLIRSQGGKAEQAARLVLVDGMRNTDASKQTGVSMALMSNTIKRYHNALELAKQAAG